MNSLRKDIEKGQIVRLSDGQTFICHGGFGLCAKHESTKIYGEYLDGGLGTISGLDIEKIVDLDLV